MTEHEWDDLWNEFAQAWNDASPSGPDREAAARQAIAAEAVAPWREALRDLESSHNGYHFGVGPCICEAHVEARALLAPEGSEP